MTPIGILIIGTLLMSLVSYLLLTFMSPMALAIAIPISFIVGFFACVYLTLWS